MMWRDPYGWGLGGFFLMLVFMVLFWGGIIALVVWGVRQFRPGPSSSSFSSSPGGDADPALRILEERFARGEIDEDEFRRRREILRGHAPS
jgi:putative membrane protein